jgi:uncharacterized delta-60 repeat protein
MRWGRKGIAAAACMAGMALSLCAPATAAGPREAEVVRLPPGAGEPSELVAYNNSKLLLLDPQEETITRVNNDGSLDTSFGGDGRIKRFFRGVAVDGRGRILLASSGRSPSSSSGWDAKVVGLLPNGRLDRSFGTDGVALVDLGGAHDDGNTVAVTRNGRILVGGAKVQLISSRGPAPGEAAVARLLPNGRVDRSFGRDGVRILPGGSDYGVRHLIPTRSGGIVAEGEGYIGISIWRVSRFGSVIRSFGRDGEVELAARTIPSGKKVELLWDEGIGVLPDNRIVAVAEYPALIVCLNRRGRIDHTFGRDGWVNPGHADLTESSFAVLPGGVTLIAGYTADRRRDATDLVPIAIGPDGALESDLGARARVRFDLPFWATDVINQGGRAVVLGSTEGEDERSKYWLIRFPAPNPG